jgi:hypothetical protein
MPKFVASSVGAVPGKGEISSLVKGTACIPESMVRTMLATIDTKLPNNMMPHRYFEWTTDCGNTICAERVNIRDNQYSWYFTMKDND